MTLWGKIKCVEWNLKVICHLTASFHNLPPSLVLCFRWRIHGIISFVIPIWWQLRRRFISVMLSFAMREVHGLDDFVIIIELRRWPSWAGPMRLLKTNYAVLKAKTVLKLTSDSNIPLRVVPSLPLRSASLSVSTTSPSSASLKCDCWLDESLHDSGLLGH